MNRKSFQIIAFACAMFISSSSMAASLAIQTDNGVGSFLNLSSNLTSANVSLKVKGFTSFGNQMRGDSANFTNDVSVGGSLTVGINLATDSIGAHSLSYISFGSPIRLGFDTGGVEDNAGNTLVDDSGNFFGNGFGLNNLGTVPADTAHTNVLLILHSGATSVRDLASMLVGTGGSGTVTSVAQTVPQSFSVSGSPITGSGTLAITRNGGNDNLVGGSITNALAVTGTNNAGPAIVGGKPFANPTNVVEVGTLANPFSMWIGTNGLIYGNFGGATNLLNTSKFTAGVNITLTPSKDTKTGATNWLMALSDPITVSVGNFTTLNSTAFNLTTNTAGGTAFDFSRSECTTNMAGDVVFSSVANLTAGTYNRLIEHCMNNTGSDHTITIQTGWGQGLNDTYTVTNGTQMDVLAWVQPGVKTNVFTKAIILH